ncbi:hypothetical protein [Escherichia phage vB_EcoM-E33]|uniref:Transglycosylase SLT domain-containing protein n=1 Tax=Escherichia phage QL01 TaxID=1673871 RepID=A0A0K1LKF3_9CAUD|nr:hypothetical protein AVT32_gp105 [Escherichia phage QL01]AKU42763.1 hypothetical protein QL01_106 [Escherichia phage QL01]QXV72465.1 hypothetical protein PSD9_180 [Shigella phage PSD9]UKH48894.1 hypothetical protein [Escherichia phage vB_EcoM-E33]
MKKVLATLLLTVSMSAHSVEPTFSNEQLDNLHYAYAFGEQYQKSGKFKENPNQKGLGYIMAGLLWQESSAGINQGLNKDKHHAYGMFQNYLPTLRSRVQQVGWKMSDKEIIRMVQKRQNSASWAYIELSYWIDVHKGDLRKAIASYNAGWNAKAGSKYASEVLEKANYLKSKKMFEAVY